MKKNDSLCEDDFVVQNRTTRSLCEKFVMAVILMRGATVCNMNETLDLTACKIGNTDSYQNTTVKQSRLVGRVVISGVCPPSGPVMFSAMSRSMPGIPLGIQTEACWATSNNLHCSDCCQPLGLCALFLVECPIAF